MTLTCATGGPATGKFVSARTKSGSTNLPEGIVRIFREPPQDAETSSVLTAPTTGENAPASTSHDPEDIIMGVLAVPAWMTPSDFLAFVAPAAEGMAHLRMIRLVFDWRCFPSRCSPSSITVTLRRIVLSWLSSSATAQTQPSSQRLTMANSLIPWRYALSQTVHITTIDVHRKGRDMSRRANSLD